MRVDQMPIHAAAANLTDPTVTLKDLDSRENLDIDCPEERPGRRRASGAQRRRAARFSQTRPQYFRFRDALNG